MKVLDARRGVVANGALIALTAATVAGIAIGVCIVEGIRLVGELKTTPVLRKHFQS